MTNATDIIFKKKPFTFLKKELTAGLHFYWETAADVLKNSRVQLLAPEPGDIAFEKNMFSTLFLYSFYRAGISEQRRILYVAVNQCLRGMVTGCDNLLDDEYKKTLDTDLPEQGAKFRSVLDIMASDRILYETLLKFQAEKQISSDQVITMGRASLHCLLESGKQEASEEAGINERLTPKEILNKIHHFKTGLLFQSPWALPEIIETLNSNRVVHLKAALYQMGMGCQLLDDMVDLGKDIRDRRHNYAASLILHNPDSDEKTEFEKKIQEKAFSIQRGKAIMEFPDARRQCTENAMAFLHQGMNTLFAQEHHEAMAPFMKLIIKRIGAEELIK